MSDERQRERERRRWYLERFLQRTDSGRVEGEAAADEPGPDVRVKAADRAVSVRIAELLAPGGDPGVRESVRAFRSAVVQAAEERWARRPEGPEVEVWVEFSDHEQTTAARDRDDLARRLCGLVESELPEVGGFARIVAGWSDAEADVPLVAPALTVARLPTYSGTTWHAVSTAGRKEVDANRLADVIAGASRTGAELSEDTDERWLVVVLESYRHPSMGGVPEEAASESYASAFDRIWLYDPGSDEARELVGG